MTATRKRQSRNKGLLTVALFKFATAFVVTFATITAVRLMHKNVPYHFSQWIDMLRIDPDNRYVAWVLQKLRVIHTKELQQLAGLGFFYAALFYVEGIGLALEQRWAEWLTLLATGLFIPIEIYGLCTKPSAGKVAILLVNIGIVIFLAYLLRQKSARD